MRRSIVLSFDPDAQKSREETTNFVLKCFRAKFPLPERSRSRVRTRKNPDPLLQKLPEEIRRDTRIGRIVEFKLVDHEKRVLGKYLRRRPQVLETDEEHQLLKGQKAFLAMLSVISTRQQVCLSDAKSAIEVESRASVGCPQEPPKKRLLPR